MWEEGRGLTGYWKMLLCKLSFFDTYLIYYPPGSQIKTHVDPVQKGYEHFRANFLLKGEDAYVGDYLFKFWRLVVFRPDIMPHSVKEVLSERYVLSFGFMKEE